MVDIRINNNLYEFNGDGEHSDIVQDSAAYHYWGDPDTNGSFRMGVDTGVFVIQERINGTWITIGSFDYTYDTPA